MKNSTFSFLLITVPAFFFVAFFFNHSFAIFPILLAFLKHVCNGWETFMLIAPMTMVQISLVLFFFISAVTSLSMKIVSLGITTWKVRHLKKCKQLQKYTQLSRFQATHSKTQLLSSKKPFAFCHFDIIYLSTGAFEILTEKELEAVFLHELHHAHHFDSARTWILELLSRCLFFPVLRSFITDFKLDLELEADRFVRNSQGSGTFLKGALLKVISYPTLSVSHFSACQLEQRVHALKRSPSYKFRWRMHSFLGVMTFFLLSAVFLHHAKMALAMSEMNVHQDSNFCVNDNDVVIPMSVMKNYSPVSR